MELAPNNGWTKRPAYALCWALGLLALGNALVYAWNYADPLIISDGWYFLEVFVRPALEGHLSLGDFFVKRSGFDHAQPLRKLILLGELRWFDLDFRPQAIAGVLCAGGCALVVARVLVDARHAPPVLRWLVAALVAVLLCSLNSSAIWAWPLVGLGYSSHLLVFGFFAVAWRSLAGGKLRWHLLMTLALALVADDSSLLALVALLLVLAACWCKRVHRERVVAVAVIALVVIGLEQFLVRWLGPVVGGVPPLADRWLLLWQALLDGGWWQWWVYPFADSLMLKRQLAARTEHVLFWQLLIGVGLAVAHLWFWWRFLRDRTDGARFFAGALMLISYAFLAGILLGRVPTYGSDYLHQPRYVLLYQFQLVALLVMWAATWRGWHVPVSILAVPLLLWLQLSLAIRSWDIAHYITNYYERTAEQIVAMGDDPATTPESCLPVLPPCKWDAERRADLIGLLKKHQLNVFSPAFQRRHNLPPQGGSAP